MVVTNFDKTLFKYDVHNIFKDKSLINKKSLVFSNYWDYDSGLLATDEEKSVIKLLASTDEEAKNEVKKAKD